MEIPDDLYRKVKAKSALEGRAVREVIAELFRRYVGQQEPSVRGREGAKARSQRVGDAVPVPSWFGVLRKQAQRVQNHDFEAIRESIARGVAAERGR